MAKIVSPVEHRVTPDLTLYGGGDPRDFPRYTYTEAARATDVPPTTIAAWFRGQRYARKKDVAFFSPVLTPAKSGDHRLSFNNLLEIHVVRALREVHDVKLATIRRAKMLAEKQYGVPRLLTSSQLRTSGGTLFLDSYFSLVELSPSHQLAMRSILKDFLQRIRQEDAKGIVEFFPIPRVPENRNREIVLLSPFIAFGEPIIQRVGISTRAIAERVNVGEDQASVMKDYDLAEEEFWEAIRYEAAA